MTKEIAWKIDSFIKEHRELPYRQIMEIMNKELGVNYKLSTYLYRGNQLGLEPRTFKYKEIHNKWIVSNLDGLLHNDAYLKFCEEFNVKPERCSFFRKCKKLGIHLKRDLRIGCPNKIGYEIGTDTVIHGRVYTKVRNDIVGVKKNPSHNPNYKPKEHVVYEKYYGQIEEDCRIIHLDGNPLNTDISNLKKVKKSTQAVMTVNKWWHKNESNFIDCATEQIELEQILKEGNNGKKYLSKVSQR